MEQTQFNDIIDELNWQAVVMSEGNIEAVSAFVQERNKIRENENSKQNTTKEKF